MFAAFLHKTTKKTFSAWVAEFAAGTVSIGRVHALLTIVLDPDSPFHPTFVELVARLAPLVDDAVVHSRDYLFS